MKGELKPIRSKADYRNALAEVERLWGAKSGTPPGDRLDILTTLIDAYEDEHYPIDPPDPVEAIKFRMETAGPEAQRPRTAHRNAHARGRGVKLQAQPVDCDDSAIGIPAEVLIRPSRKKKAAWQVWW